MANRGHSCCFIAIATGATFIWMHGTLVDGRIYSKPDSTWRRYNPIINWWDTFSASLSRGCFKFSRQFGKLVYIYIYIPCAARRSHVTESSRADAAPGRSCHICWQWLETPARGPPAQRWGSCCWTFEWFLRSSDTATTTTATTTTAMSASQLQLN